MISAAEIAIRLGLAAFFGSVIGFERERKDWAAGLRTHMMVCVGSALIMMVSSFGFSDILGTSHVDLDPSRIAAQVVSGIGFIGAGTILFLRQGAIRGLTTASGLWTVAAIGLATGGGMYAAALIATVIAFVILWGLKPLEKRFFDRYKQTDIQITAAEDTDVLNKVFRDNKFEISECSVKRSDGLIVVSFRIRGLTSAELTAFMNQLKTDPQIKEVTWNN